MSKMASHHFGQDDDIRETETHCQDTRGRGTVLHGICKYLEVDRLPLVPWKMRSVVGLGVSAFKPGV